MTAREILTAHPGPWIQLNYPNGTIVVRDANHKTVELLTILEFSTGIVASITTSGGAAKVAPFEEAPLQ